MVPAEMITSAWRGVARATSNPNRDQSYFAEAAAIISMAQQLVPKTKGHNEFERDQFTTLSSEDITNPPPGQLFTVPGKLFISSSCFVSVMLKFTNILSLIKNKFSYSHFKAPFFHAYSNPRKSINTKIRISTNATIPTSRSTTAQGKRKTISTSKIKN